MSIVQQNVWVQATMPQRYNGVQRGSGDKFEMLDSDAADSVALNMVSRLKPKDIPSAKPVVKQTATRTMEATDGEAEKAAASETEKATAGAADTAAQAPATAAPAHSSPSQRPYPHRNMHARK